MADDTITPAEPKTADELRSEFRTAQRRRLFERGVAFWRDTDVPHSGPLWTKSPPPDKVE
jgi:hypothetical protein